MFNNIVQIYVRNPQELPQLVAVQPALGLADLLGHLADEPVLVAALISLRQNNKDV